MNCFRWAGIYTGLAVHAHVLVDFCLLIFQSDCRCGAFTHAGFASGTFLFVNDCYQSVHSIVYVSVDGKKGFYYELPPSGGSEWRRRLSVFDFGPPLSGGSETLKIQKEKNYFFSSPSTSFMP